MTEVMIRPEKSYIRISAVCSKVDDRFLRNGHYGAQREQHEKAVQHLEIERPLLLTSCLEDS